jgi:hypothetical protein
MSNQRKIKSYTTEFKQSSAKLFADSDQKFVKVQELLDERIRYYQAERPSRTLAPTRGSSHVTE